MMIDLHYSPTPTGWKVTIMLEECGLPYRVAPVNILKGEQFEPDFRKIAPNNRIPAIIDHAPGWRRAGQHLRVRRNPDLPRREDRQVPAEGRPGALRHLAVAHVADGRRRTHIGPGRLLPQLRQREDRARNQPLHHEVNRLYGVVDTRLNSSEFTAGADSLARMATLP